jgi:LPS-assembly lipoprotein
VRRDRRKFFSALTLIAALPFALQGCGFHPLYAEKTGAASKLESVRIEPLQERNGQMLHNMLRDRINPSGQPANPEYLLRVSLKEKTTGLGIRKDKTASRYNLSVETRYTLYTVDGKTVLFRGESAATSGYSALDLPAQYGTLSAERDARERASQVVAEDIAQRLAVYFAAQSAGS